MEHSIDREKVIRGLELCASGGMCIGRDCPYWHNVIDDAIKECDCTTELVRDALAMLKEQEARTLTLSEALGLKKHDEIWIEYTGCHDKLFMLTIARVRRWGLTFFQHLPCPWDKYGGNPESETDWRWRVWTAKPTEEQMQAVKWE